VGSTQTWQFYMKRKVNKAAILSGSQDEVPGGKTPAKQTLGGKKPVPFTESETKRKNRRRRRVRGLAQKVGKELFGGGGKGRKEKHVEWNEN